MDKLTDDKKRNIRDIAIAIISICIIVCILYVGSQGFRKFVDKNILRKYATEENAKEIYLNSENNPKVLAYDKYLAIYELGEFKLYNKNGMLKTEDIMSFSVSNPIFKTNDKYALIASKMGNKIVCVKGDKLNWEKKLDYNITNISINKKGYAVVIGTNSMYKSIITVISNYGEEIFNIYFATNTVVDAEVSPDNKQLAVAEINYSKPIIESMVKIISMDNARVKPDDSVIKTYSRNSLLVNIKFKPKNIIMAHYKDKVFCYDTKEEKEIYNIDNDVQFLDIESDKNFVVIKKAENKAFKNKYNLIVFNEKGKQKALCVIGDYVPKTLKLASNMIGINLGQEAKILTIDGRERKNYNSKKEIKEIYLSDSLTIIAHKDLLYLLEN